MVKLFSATAAIGVLATTTAFTASSAAPAGPYTAQADSDRITSLPGWPAGKPFPSNMYSGYIDVGKKSGVAGKIHYWFVESQNSPKDDPVVYWTNGGPGGSGISTGLLTEMGALQLNEDSLPAGIESDSSKKVVPNLLENDYAWSKVANMLYVSQPKGVGFSYCPDGERACQNNDVSAAQDAYEFFVNFFERFPSLKKNDFYLTAESYGGIYLPMFMDEIDRNGGVPNFKGAAIGDGCWGTAVGTCAFSTGKSHEINVEFFQGHGMYDQELYKRIKQSCGSFSDDDVQKKDCKADLDEMQTKIGKFDIYNIYDTCQAIDTPHAAAKRRMAKLEATGSADLPTLAAVRNHVSLGGALNDFACGGDEVSEMWLELDETATALHVDASKANSGMNYTWGPVEASGDLRPLYKRLAEKYRILIYSGDVDGCVPFWGTQEWTRELGFPVRKGWHSWHAPVRAGGKPQRAGYAIEYDTHTNFKFVTIQGSGHMVPTYKPDFALSMITKFLNDVPFN